jgi:hypothetical protein
MSTTIEMLVARVETLEKQLAMLLKDQVVDVKKSKKSKDTDEVVKVKETKKSKKSKDEPSSEDEDKPKKKRGPNGYILFSNANRDEVKEKLHVGDEKPKNTEVMKELAQMWQTLDATEKADWNAKAKASHEE